jgi:hypothetical protein
MKTNKFPKGWDENRVRKVLAHYGRQTEEQAVAEDVIRLQTKAAKDDGVTVREPRGRLVYA